MKRQPDIEEARELLQRFCDGGEVLAVDDVFLARFKGSLGALDWILGRVDIHNSFDEMLNQIRQQLENIWQVDSE